MASIDRWLRYFKGPLIDDPVRRIVQTTTWPPETFRLRMPDGRPFSLSQYTGDGLADINFKIFMQKGDGTGAKESAGGVTVEPGRDDTIRWKPATGDFSDAGVWHVQIDLESDTHPARQIRFPAVIYHVEESITPA